MSSAMFSLDAPEEAELAAAGAAEVCARAPVLQIKRAIAANPPQKTGPFMNHPPVVVAGDRGNAVRS
jgi:hypothetical protein